MPSSTPGEASDVPILHERVPVVMPDLPAKLVLTTPQQFRAVHDPTRIRILGMILHQPMTAKQIADRLAIPHGTIGHHLQILEEAGLARVVAKRSVRSMIAKYYARTARLFDYRIPPEVTGSDSLSLDLITQVRDEMADALDLHDPADVAPMISVRHLRLSAEQIKAFEVRLSQLLDEIGQLAPDQEGVVYGLCGALYMAPEYLQVQQQMDESADQPTGGA
jgi:DNA-binding transcriptional ArsR family regulator